MEIVWSLLEPYKMWLGVVGCILVGLFAFSQIWKIQLEKAYVRYTEMVYKHGLSLKDAEKMFMQILFNKVDGTNSEFKAVRKHIKDAIKANRIIKIEYTYEGEMSVRYFAHNEDVHAFRALMLKQAKWIKTFSWIKPFNIYRFTLHDLEFKKEINQ